MWFTDIPKLIELPFCHSISILPTQLSSAINGLALKRVLIITLYWDRHSLDEIRRIRLQSQCLITTGVIASDINNIGDYSRWLGIANFFIAPSPEHASLLESFVDVDVFPIEEPVDPIVKQNQSFQKDYDGWLAWFGYRESFDKGMKFLLPAISECVNRNYIKGLKIITNINENIDTPSWLRIIPYSLDSACSEISKSKFTLLSHFPYDLQINSFIKTDNKAILSLACGSLPLASSTPSYSRLLRSLNLEMLLYDGPTSLIDLIRRVCPIEYYPTTKQLMLINQALESRSILRTSMKIRLIANSFLG